MKNITFSNVSFKYITKKILDVASFSFTDCDKVGVVGVNGCGKSTILKLIMNEEKPNNGSILISGDTRINYLEQDPKFPTDISILDIIMKDSCKDYPILDYEAKSILSKMGFIDYTITTKNMSGGEIKRIALAKVLVTPCDFLLLDEPTNHLDNDLIEFLEKYLIKFKKAYLWLLMIDISYKEYVIECLN